MTADAPVPPEANADLYWLPLGAGGVVVGRVGRLYEWFRARLEHREPRHLYHSALIVHLPSETFVIEQTPATRHGQGRGVVCVGPVGIRWPGRWPFPLYEVHSWRDGFIADVSEAVGGPVGVSSNDATCRRMLECLADLPVPVWGRDELHTGEMWNSNSVIAWVLSRSGVDMSYIAPPAGGDAPGWRAGLVVEARGLRTKCPQ